MKDKTYKGLSLYERFDKFSIEPKFDVDNLNRLVEIVEEYIDEAPIEETIDKILDNPNEVFMNWRTVVAKAIRKMLKGEIK